MNKHFLKSIRDKMPEPLKLITGPLFRNSLIRHTEFRRYTELLEKREKMSPDEIQGYQFNQLKYVLNYAYRNVPYYHELFDRVSFKPSEFSDVKEMEKIPFLTRELIMENHERLISTELVNDGYYMGATGGSTGAPLKFLLDYNSIYRENAFIYYFRRKLGYKVKDKLASFRYSKYEDKLWKYNPMHNEMIFSPSKLSANTVKQYAERLDKFNPQFINGYLSSVWFFTKLLDEHKISLKSKIRGVFLMSENIDTRQREFIENFYNVKSATFYGHTERTVIGEEVEANIYRFDPFYGYTEMIPLEGDECLIVGTGFLSQKMPFIRYKTDDTCTPVNGNYAIHGKRSSTVGLYGLNNEFLSAAVYSLASESHPNVLTFQYVQTQLGKADLLLVVNKDFNSDDMARVKRELDDETQGIISIEVNVRIVDQLILSPCGKYQMYVTHLNGNPCE